ncbi:MAG: hypothetical protein JRJ69_18310 [Deltaproteobacteria bacterium]|nr:hypothetical protein [Deltaproteobacteria bacterium]
MAKTIGSFWAKKVKKRVEKIRLNKEEKRLVGTWLKYAFIPEYRQHQEHSCPFDEYCKEGRDCCEVCRSWFPAVEGTDICPCGVYEMPAVMRKAVEMLEY